MSKRKSEPPLPPSRDWGERIGRAADGLTEYLERLERRRAERPGVELPYLGWVSATHLIVLCAGAQALVGLSLLYSSLIAFGGLKFFLALTSLLLAWLLTRRIAFLHHANLILSTLALLTIPFGSILAIFMSSSTEHTSASAGLGSLGLALMLFLALSAIGSAAALWQDR